MNYKIFVLSIIVLQSCNRYIDKSVGSVVRVQQGYMQFYSDSNILEYRSNVGLTRDTEKIYPKSFRVKLPKRIKFYEFVGSSDFTFYYNKSQAIVIKINLEDSDLRADTSYVPSEAELHSFIQGISVGNHKTYNIKKMRGVVQKVNRIIIKGNASILLYNILEGNEKVFSDYLSSFAFLD